MQAQFEMNSDFLSSSGDVELYQLSQVYLDEIKSKQGNKDGKFHISVKERIVVEFLSLKKFIFEFIAEFWCNEQRLLELIAQYKGKR